MAKGIIIIGPSGAGKTTLGKALGQALNYPYFDIDDYIWKKGTALPYTTMNSRQEKIDGLKEAISHNEHFVMGGSMTSFHQAFDNDFEMMVFLKADVNVRIERINQRAIQRFGNRIKEGGDMYQNHLDFIAHNYAYEADGSPNLKVHTAWFESLDCLKLELRGEDSIESNVEKIVNCYHRMQKNIRKQLIIENKQRLFRINK